MLGALQYIGRVTPTKGYTSRKDYISYWYFTMHWLAIPISAKTTWTLCRHGYHAPIQVCRYLAITSTTLARVQQLYKNAFKHYLFSFRISKCAFISKFPDKDRKKKGNHLEYKSP